MSTSPPIVHATDFSAASEPAFRRALDLAAREARELVLVHAMEPIPIFADEAGVGETDAVRKTAEAAARARMDALLDRAKARRITASDVVVEGRPADVIVKVAKSLDADVIVMGTHGRTGLARVVMGSVAERVLATAPCPVLMVRAG
jgi:nucleotide-binding universal stress UspA family protein